MAETSRRFVGPAIETRLWVRSGPVIAPALPPAAMKP